MFIEIVQSLRCPNPHPDGWLVASCDRLEDRHILEGRLGCPTCKAEFPIRQGAVWFVEPARSTSSGPELPEEEGLRVAAALDLSEDQGFAVLSGEWADVAAAVLRISVTPLVLLNPRSEAGGAGAVSVVHARNGSVFAAGSVRAAAAAAELLPSLVRALRPGGRILAPADAAVPDEVKLLARDDSVWVGETAAAPAPIELTRRRGG